MHKAKRNAGAKIEILLGVREFVGSPKVHRKCYRNCREETRWKCLTRLLDPVWRWHRLGRWNHLGNGLSSGLGGSTTSSYYRQAVPSGLDGGTAGSYYRQAMIPPYQAVVSLGLSIQDFIRLW